MMILLGQTALIPTGGQLCAKCKPKISCCTFTNRSGRVCVFVSVSCCFENKRNMFHVIVFTFATQLTLTAIVLLNFSTAEAYIYRPGNQCPRPTDIGDGFDMDRFLGHWYVVQRSRSPMPASCMVYNITRQPPSEDDDVDNAEQNHYRIEQITYFRPAERKYKLTYAGKLEAKTAANRGNNGTASSRMSVKFPMSEWFDVHSNKGTTE